MSTNDPGQPAAKQSPTSSVEDIFGGSAPLRSAEDLTRAGIFYDREVDKFIADLSRRGSDVA